MEAFRYSWPYRQARVCLVFFPGSLPGDAMYIDGALSGEERMPIGTVVVIKDRILF